MLYLILCYFGISFVCLWTGIIFYSFFPGEKTRQRPVIYFLLTGLVIITAIGQWIELVFPVTVVSLLFIAGLCIIFTLRQRKRIYEAVHGFMACLKGRNILFVACMLCLFSMILVLNSGPFIMDDTDSYHIQMVKWIQEYGSVPGIANLHLRFGLNSSWFLSIALFRYPVQGLNSYGALNGVLSIWISFYLLKKIFIYSNDPAPKSKSIAMACLILLCLCLLNWPMIRGSAANTNYDFISTCCVIPLFIDLINDQKENHPIEWLIWPVYLFTVRMLNFPLLIFSLVYILQFLKKDMVSKLLSSLSGALFIVVPFLIRNCILSGYAFFPVYQLDFFSFDWKADKAKVIEISRYIKYFNRVNPMFQPMAITERLVFPNWLTSWFTNLFRFDKLVLIFSVLGYAGLLFRFKEIKSRPVKIFLVVMLCQLISWFFIAPDPRFVYGALLIGIFAGIEGLHWTGNVSKKMINYSLVITSSAVLIYTVSKVIRNNDYRNFLTPYEIPVPAFRNFSVDHIQMHIPGKILNNWNPRCYDVDLPCLYIPDPRLEARGKVIADGFRLKKTDNYIFSGGEYKITE